MCRLLWLSIDFFLLLLPFNPTLRIVDETAERFIFRPRSVR